LRFSAFAYSTWLTCIVVDDVWYSCRGQGEVGTIFGKGKNPLVVTRKKPTGSNPLVVTKKKPTGSNKEKTQEKTHSIFGVIMVLKRLKPLRATEDLGGQLS